MRLLFFIGFSCLFLLAGSTPQSLGEQRRGYDPGWPLITTAPFWDPDPMLFCPMFFWDPDPWLLDQPVRKGISHDSVIQDQSPTCAFAASLSAVAWSGEDLAGRLRCLGEHRYNVTLFRPILLFGTPVPKKEEVTIEFTGFDEQHRDLRSRHSREYWPALFQRAYLKLNAVNMDSWKTPDGDNHYASPAIALFQLTGRVAERWDPNARNSQADLIDLVHQRRPLVAGTPSKEGKRLMPNSLMVYDHSYTIVAADEGGVTLRNPWGHDTDVERYRLIEPSGEGLRIRSPKAALPRLGFVDGFTDGLGDNPLDGLIKLDWPTFRRDIKNVWYIPPIVQAQRQRHGGGMR